MQAVCKSPSPVDYVVVDDMSRLSRDLGDTFTLFKQLQFDGVEIFGASDGYSSEGKMAKVNLGMRALMNDMFIEDLREKTHRGQKGQALLGRSTGGRLFGYRSVPTSSNEDDGKRRVVHEGEAEIVRKMFVMAAEGKTLQAIVRELVKQGAPSPDPGKRPDRRKGWSVSSARAVLVNPHYKGEVVWNTRRFEKNPKTGKRGAKKRPPEEWVVRQEPEFAIVSPELFDAVRRNFDERAKQYGRGPDGKMRGHARGGTRSAALLSSLVKCGVCGGAMALIGGKKNPHTGEAYRQYQCAFAKRHGGAECANKLTISKKKLEQAVTAELVTRLLNDEAIAYFENEFRRAFAEEADRMASGTKRAELEKLLNDEQVKIQNLLGFIETGASQAVAGRLREAESRAAKLKADIEAMTVAANQWETPPTKAIRNELLRLRDNLTGDDPASAKPMLKALVGELKLYPEKLPELPVVETPVKMPEPKKRKNASKKPAKEKSRATWGFRVVGSLFLENILVPIAGDQVCPPDVAGAKSSTYSGTPCACKPAYSLGGKWRSEAPERLAAAVGLSGYVLFASA